MSRKLIIICISLLLTSASYAGVIGNWENDDGNYDGWGTWDGSAVVPSTNFAIQSVYGVTLDSSALEVAQSGWGQCLALDLTYDQRVDLANNNTFSIDFSVAPGTSGGRLEFAEAVMNAEGRGWAAMTMTNDVSENNYFDFWDGSPARTMTLTGSYDPGQFGSGSGPGIPGYCQIVIALNDNSSGHLFYFDNAVLTPEPATIAMLGLGGLALIRRKR